jgi:hypothetical protein
MTAPHLDVYDVAFLAGGPKRVVDTAIVELVRRGALRVHRPGQLATASLARRHAVEAAVLDAVGPTGHRSVEMVCWRLLGDERLLDIGRRLRDRGLVGRGVAARLPGGSRRLTPTRAGRKVLARAGELPGIDAEILRVARGGRADLADARLRASIFEPPDTEPVIPRSRRPKRWDSAEIAAQRTGVYGVAGGGATVGHWDVGGFDGGGGGGGDGGGF